MNSLLVAVSIALFAVGGIVGFVPLSVLNTVSFSTPNVTCGSNGACTVTFTITNNNATSNFAVYMKVTNAAYQNIWSNTIQMASAASTLNVNQLSIGILPPGAYIFNVLAFSNYGVVLSGTTSQAFNVGGNYVLTIDPYNSATGSVSVSPACTINPATQSTCPLPVGTPVTVTFSPTSGYLFGQWCYWYSGSTLPPSDRCTVSGNFGQKSGQFTSSTNPLQFTMTGNYELVYSVSQSSPALNIQYFTVTPSVSITGGCPLSPSASCVRGSVSPSGTSKIYSLASASYGQTSQIFTASPSANFTFANFQANGKNFTQNPLKLNYSALQPLQSSGQIDFELYAYFEAKQFYQLGVGAYSGITTTPATKTGSTYYYPAGASVTVTIANVASNVCFTGWLVDGNSAGTANSVTVTMNSYHSVFAQGVGKPSGGCGSTTGGSGSGQTGQTNPPLAIPFFAAGGVTLLVGLRRRR